MGENSAVSITWRGEPSRLTSCFLPKSELSREPSHLTILQSYKMPARKTTLTLPIAVLQRSPLPKRNDETKACLPPTFDKMDIPCSWCDVRSWNPWREHPDSNACIGGSSKLGRKWNPLLAWGP